MVGDQPVLLIVQEDQVLSATTANIATQCGYEPRVVGNSRDFSRAYRDSVPETIFMELFMPDMDGMEMVNWLIEEKSQSKVIMTAKQNPEVALSAVLVAKAAKLFTVTSLSLPVSVDEIQGALRAALHET